MENVSLTQDQLFQSLLEIEANLKAIYEKRTQLMTSFRDVMKSDFAIIKNEDGTWTRIAFTDNAEKINEGIVKIVKVERFSIKVDVLKNMPKELK
jgi:3-polyprenyl-4-hydroxybenzoate decarboxylase